MHWTCCGCGGSGGLTCVCSGGTAPLFWKLTIAGSGRPDCFPCTPGGIWYKLESFDGEYGLPLVGSGLGYCIYGCAFYLTVRQGIGEFGETACESAAVDEFVPVYTYVVVLNVGGSTQAQYFIQTNNTVIPVGVNCGAAIYCGGELSKSIITPSPDCTPPSTTLLGVVDGPLSNPNGPFGNITATFEPQFSGEAGDCPSLGDCIPSTENAFREARLCSNDMLCGRFYPVAGVADGQVWADNDGICVYADDSTPLVSIRFPLVNLTNPKESCEACLPVCCTLSPSGEKFSDDCYVSIVVIGTLTGTALTPECCNPPNFLFQNFQVPMTSCGVWEEGAYFVQRSGDGQWSFSYPAEPGHPPCLPGQFCPSPTELPSPPEVYEDDEYGYIMEQDIYGYTGGPKMRIHVEIRVINNRCGTPV